MNTTTKRIYGAGLLASVALGTGMVAFARYDSGLDPDRIASASGAKATVTPDGVVRIAWPRSDVRVSVDGVPMKPFAGLGSWAAFTKTPHGAMVMGDTVVFQDEVDPAMDAAFAHGLEVTGLHNHFFYDEPKVYFMHVGGRGEPEALATGIRAVWDAIRKVRASEPAPRVEFGETGPEADEVPPAMAVRRPARRSRYWRASRDGMTTISSRPWPPFWRASACRRDRSCSRSYAGSSLVPGVSNDGLQADLDADLGSTSSQPRRVKKRGV
jgi:hypothetical protein